MRTQSFWAPFPFSPILFWMPPSPQTAIAPENAMLQFWETTGTAMTCSERTGQSRRAYGQRRGKHDEESSQHGAGHSDRPACCCWRPKFWVFNSRRRFFMGAGHPQLLLTSDGTSDNLGHGMLSLGTQTQRPFHTNGC